jgi:prepilin-type N-terminal cleavage/methylation domain-containing protein
MCILVYCVFVFLMADTGCFLFSARETLSRRRNEILRRSRAYVARKLHGEGFTLIELAIVLVIIGLIVGGVLVGQDLIRAAGVRATITQVERFNTAANTFKDKTGYLPGDIPPGLASQFGLPIRAGSTGNGDGNGVITARGDGAGVGFTQEPGGETTLFWADLSAMGLIEGKFTVTSGTADISLTTMPDISSLLPPAKIGRGNFFYVYSSSPNTTSTSWNIRVVNFFGISAVNLVAVNSNHGLMNSTAALTVNEAYSIDKKIDDGMPGSGRIQALYLNASIQEAPVWAAGGGVAGASLFYQGPDYGLETHQAPASATSCYDNGDVYGGTLTYSLEISNGSNVNCALSFQMQAGD